MLYESVNMNLNVPNNVLQGAGIYEFIIYESL